MPNESASGLTAYQRRYQERKARGDRHSSGGHTARARRSRDVWPGPRAYLDGEALGGEYRLLQFLHHPEPLRTLESAQRLSSRECFLALYDGPPTRYYGFGLGYDVSHWLADLPLRTYEHLRQTNWCRWQRWIVHYIPRKTLTVIDPSRAAGDKARSVYDLYSYFQTPFVAALEAAHIPVEPIIREGKRRRGRFTDPSFVRAYNEAELRSMARLHEWLIDCLRAGDLYIRHWTGPGACARYEAKRRGVNVAVAERDAFLAARRDLKHAGTSLEPERQGPHAAVVDAFYGGRFELSRLGPVEQCWEYDLASAYPAALAAGMPCFACGGEWRPEPGEWSVVEVEWWPRAPVRSPVWGPLPNRMTRNLAWTVNGRGWYHTAEAEAAERWLGHLYHFQRLRYWSWHPACTHDPWRWVGEMARERVAIKQTDPGRAQAQKLTLNSLYGICCDKAGVVNGRKPLYHNPYWGGLVTARTRARLLEAAGVGGERIIYLATDGVHASEPLPLVTGNDLGDWEPPSRAGIPAVFLAPGTYIYADGKRGKSRGVPLGSFPADLNAWRRLWRMTQANGHINLKSRHFVALSEARGRATDELDYLALANSWETRPRTLSYDLRPRRAYRKTDDRWVAPTDLDWQIGAAHLLLPTDATMILEEEAAWDQPRATEEN